MLRRKPRKRSSLHQTISILGKNVGGNLDKNIQKELEEQAKIEAHSAHCVSRLRLRGRSILHSKIVLLLVVLLCMVDCVLVIGELILDMHAIKAMGDNGHGSVDHSKCVKEIEYDYDYETGSGEKAPTTEAHEVHHVHTIEEKIAHGFHYASISILLVLVVETLIKIFCFGAHFLKKKFEVFDALVVFLSLVLDLVFLDGTTSRSIQESAYILSFLLPWRVIRVVNSMIVALFDHEHIKLLLMFKSKQYLSKQIDELSDDLTVLQNQLGAIRKLACEHNIPEWKISQVLGKISSESKKKKHALSSLVSMSVGMAVESQQSIWSNTIKDQQQRQAKENGTALGVSKDENDKKLNTVLNNNHAHHVIIEVGEGNDERNNTNGNRADLADEPDSSDNDDVFCDTISHMSIDEGSALLSVVPSIASVNETF